MLQPGTRAPDFELKGEDGATHSLAGMLAGGAVVLAFFKVSCPVCRYAFPFLERLSAASREDTIRFYGVSQDGPPATGFFLEEQQIRFTALFDSHSHGFSVSNAFGIRRVPSVFVIEPDRTISAVMEGFEKAALDGIGRRVGTSPFLDGENVPEFQPG